MAKKRRPTKKASQSKVRKASSKASQRLKQSKPEKVSTELDPHLQEILLKVRDGKTVDASFAQSLPDGTVMVDVIAKVADAAVAIEGLEIARNVGKIITGRVAVSDVEKVRKHKNVLSLKRATRLHKDLEFSVGEINGTPDQLENEFSPNLLPLDGEGVIIGVVDYGGDFRHKNFRNNDGSTRLLHLWDQNGGGSQLSPNGFPYGREFDSSAINDALSESNPYQALRYNPGVSSHGTHVMDIAAGNGGATGYPGVAPKADLIFVNIAHDDIDLDEITDLQPGESINFGNSKMLMEAVEYIFVKAAALGRSAVVNISLGTHGGPHDGSTLAEQWFDGLLEEPGRAITISAGNSHQARSHASGEVTQSSPRVLSWEIHEEDDTGNELEVWYSGDQELTVSLETPTGQKLAPVALGTTVTLTNQNDEPVGRVLHRQSDPNNQDNHIDVVLGEAIPTGNWKVHLEASDSTSVPFHSWIERDYPTRQKPHRQSKFSVADDDPASTIGSISCGARTIAVGSYLSGSSVSEISPFSAEGPTRDGKQKPEVSGPGQFLHPYWEQGILAARSRSQGTTRMSGTSMSSPHVAGLIALVMQAAEVTLTIDEIRAAIIDSARLDPPVGGAWDQRYGFGRVDAIEAIESVLSFPAPATSDLLPSNPAFAVNNGTVSDANTFHSLLTAAANAAKDSKSRIRIQIEAEPA